MDKNIGGLVNGFRKVVQHLLVPELKAIRTELKYHSKQFEMIDRRFEAIDKRFETIDKRFEMVHKEIMELKIGQREILAKLEVDKRVTRLETIIEKLEKKVG